MTEKATLNQSLEGFPEYIRTTIKLVFGEDNIPTLQVPSFAPGASPDEKKHASCLATKTLLEDTIKAGSETLEPGDLTILRATHGLARTYNELGQTKDAEEEYDRLLEYSEQTHGPNYRGVWDAMYNLCRLYQNTGRPGQAERMLKDLVPLLQEDSRKGKNIHQASCAVENLVEALEAQGKNEEAKRLLEAN